MIDIDHLKSIDDRFSHQTGDEVLRTVGRLLRAGVPGVDLVARYGGEESALVFPETPVDDAFGVVERLRQSIAAHAWPESTPGLSITVSIGVVGAVPGDTPADTLGRADSRLYDAKRAGRNRTHTPKQPTPTRSPFARA